VQRKQVDSFGVGITPAALHYGDSNVSAKRLYTVLIREGDIGNAKEGSKHSIIKRGCMCAGRLGLAQKDSEERQNAWN
jgi:hypothetical protein